MKILWKIISSILAFLISILLVLSLILFPAVSFLTDSSEPSKLVDALMSSGLFAQPGEPSAKNHEILLSTDIVEDLPDKDTLESLMASLEELTSSGIIDVEQLMEDLEIPKDAQIDSAQMLQELSESKAVQTLITKYAEDILNAATGTEAPPALTGETVMGILSPHMDELVSIVERNLPKDANIDREKLSAAIDKAAGDALPTLVDALPPAKEVANALVGEDGELAMALEAFGFVRSGQLRLIALGVIAIFLLLIFLLRMPGFKGLRWIGISGLFGAVLAGGLGYLLQAKPVLVALQEAVSDASGLVMPLLKSLSSAFVNFAIIYAIAGFAFIIGCGVLNAAFVKK